MLAAKEVDMHSAYTIEDVQVTSELLKALLRRLDHACAPMILARFSEHYRPLRIDL